MREERNARAARRYVALDIHKHYCVIAAVDGEGRVVLQAVRVEHADLEGWLKKNLRANDQVVIEIHNERLACVRFAIAAGGAGRGRQFVQSKTDRECPSKDRRSRYPYSGKITSGEPGAECVGAPAACSRITSAVITTQAVGGGTHPNGEPHAQCGASSSSKT